MACGFSIWPLFSRSVGYPGGQNTKPTRHTDSIPSVLPVGAWNSRARAMPAEDFLTLLFLLLCAVETKIPARTQSGTLRSSRLNFRRGRQKQSTVWSLKDECATGKDKML